jgi:hypothetical protein
MTRAACNVLWELMERGRTDATDALKTPLVKERREMFSGIISVT